MGKIKIIYADPPWHYNDRALAGKRGASCKYPVMSVDDIKNLKIQLPKKHYRNSLFIKDIAHKNCCLFLWATAPQLPVAFDVIKAWGFDYKTIAFTWVKKTKNGKDFHRLKVINDDYQTSWVRVWGRPYEEIMPYTFWVADVAHDESWGYSTTCYKMKRVTSVD